MFGAAATVAFSLVVQIGEQVDFLRFLPEQTRDNRVRGGRRCCRVGLDHSGHAEDAGRRSHSCAAARTPASKAIEPTQMRLAAQLRVHRPRLGPGRHGDLRGGVASQINLTNAYAGSLAWSNFFARLTHSHPGRVVWLVFNVLIAVMLMTLGVFQALEKVLGLYSNVAIAWVGALVADLVINKPLGWSPAGIEFKRAHLYDINPVGLLSMLLAAALAVTAYAERWAAGAGSHRSSR
jgi:hypothetical protein